MDNLKLTLGSVALLSALAPTASMGGEKPNILWIVTDDHRADALACYNQATRGTKESGLGYVSSPELDKIASEGVLFTRAYCNSPASAPSRTSMHSGLYPHHRGVYGFEYYHDGPDYTPLTTPEYLAKAGYNTVAIGKMGVRYKTYIAPGKSKGKVVYDTYLNTKDHQQYGHTDWYPKKTWGKGVDAGSQDIFTSPDGKQLSYYYDRTNTNLTDQDQKDYVNTIAKLDILISNKGQGGQPRPKRNPNTIIGGVSAGSTEHSTDGAIMREYKSYLASQGSSTPYKALTRQSIEPVNGSQPQFHYLGFHFPHTPVMPSQSFRDRFKGKMYNVPKFDQAELDKMPKQMQSWYSKTRADKFKEDEKQQAIRDYYAFCAMGDSLIGASVKSFKEFSKKNNKEYLILIVCGDHAWHLGEQGTYAKFAAYEQSNHTAVIAVSSDKKKFPAGKVVSDYMEYVDILPTLISAGGYNTKEKEFDYLDGYDLADVVSGKVAPRDYVIGEIDAVCGPHGHIRTKDFMFGMRTRDISMVNTKNKGEAIAGDANKNMSWGLTAPLEQIDPILYDLRVDPLERNNVALDPKYRELAEFLRKKYAMIALGDGRIEVNWDEKSSYKRSTFGIGSDDKKLVIPNSIIPEVSTPKTKSKSKK